METIGMVIIVISFVVYSWAVLGLIKPISAGLPNRWASVPIWIGSVVLFISGGSFIEDGDKEVDCADWNTSGFSFAPADVSEVTRCLQAGADPNARDRLGRTPLRNAVMFYRSGTNAAGNGEVVKALIEAGADPADGTLLHDAAFFKNTGAVKALLQIGLDPNAKKRLGGDTPLHRAAGSGNGEIVRALIEARADVNAQGYQGLTPLIYAVAEPRRREAMIALLEAGADPNLTDEQGNVPLHHAASAEAVTALINTGADPNARSDNGTTPLHEAARRGTAETVTALINTGADPNARSDNGTTPLHGAAWVGTAEVVTALLEAGADVNARDDDGKLPFEDARYNQQLMGTNVYVKIAAPNARDQDGFTFLYWTALYGTGAAVTALLEAGADPNATGRNGNAPLHVAKSAEMVTALLQAGANPNVRSRFGNTPLHAAAQGGTAEMVTALLQAGADPNARDGLRFTPLHCAASGGTAEVVTALLEAGADPNARDINGKLPFDYAEDNDELRGTDAYRKLNDARFQ